MKARTSKTKIKRLLSKVGGFKELARILEINLSYVYQLEKGRKPGPRLYRDIDRLYKELIK